MSRSVCDFEVFATVDCGAAFEIVASGPDERRLLEYVRRFNANCVHDHGDLFDNIVANIETATSRNLQDKRQIDEFIEQGAGFERTNGITQVAIHSSLLELCHSRDASAQGVLSASMCAPVFAASPSNVRRRLATALGHDNKTLIHRGGASQLAQ